MTASTTTTIRGVSIFSRQRTGKADVFDIALSADGIAVQRPGRNEQRMPWERIAQWEIEERPDCVVLTLRSGGSVTPLMVQGWTLGDLETVMREVTASTRGHVAAAPAGGEGDARGGTPAAVTALVQPRSARRRAVRRRGPNAWKVLVTVVLLCALAAAVTVVLLQSAGVISWSFLGPVA